MKSTGTVVLGLETLVSTPAMKPRGQSHVNRNSNRRQYSGLPCRNYNLGMARQRRLALAVLAAVVCGAIFAWLWHGHRKSAATFERVRAGAARGDAEAQYHLGSDYYYGYGVRQDYPEAVRWYRKSAMQGSANAKYALGYCYAHGFGVTRDVNEAIRYLRQAADLGDPQALCQLARMYSEGRDLPWNRTEAFRLYRAAADQGTRAASTVWLTFIRTVRLKSATMRRRRVGH